MGEILNIEDAEIDPSRTYGGDASKKYSVVLDGEHWLVKFPRSTRSMAGTGASYATSPVSEHAGSLIYAAAGIPAHETYLALRGGKITVICKDFSYPYREQSFHEIVNMYSRQKMEGTLSGGSTALSDCIATITDTLSPASGIDGIRRRFWDMFAIDAIIGNSNRDNTNWGFFYNHDAGGFELAPVFGNGSAFCSRMGDDDLDPALTDPHRLLELALPAVTSRYEVRGSQIHPFNMLYKTAYRAGSGEEMREWERDMLDSAAWAAEALHPDAIDAVFDDVPEKAFGLEVLSPVRREAYRLLAKTRLDAISYIAEAAKGGGSAPQKLKGYTDTIARSSELAELMSAAQERAGMQPARRPAVQNAGGCGQLGRGR